MNHVENMKIILELFKNKGITLLRKNPLFSSKFSRLFKHSISISATPFSTFIRAYTLAPTLDSERTDRLVQSVRRCSDHKRK